MKTLDEESAEILNAILELIWNKVVKQKSWMKYWWKRRRLTQLKNQMLSLNILMFQA